MAASPGWRARWTRCDPLNDVTEPIEGRYTEADDNLLGNAALPVREPP
jgi:hypothetical protein